MTSDKRLADVLSEFARTVATDFPIAGILDHLVRRTVDLLPIDAAGVTLIAPPAAPFELAASDDFALHFERLQNDIGEGPGLAAFESDGPIMMPDLRSDDRYPAFAEQALRDGLGAVFTFPLRDGDLGLGALDLYRRRPGPLDDAELAAAQTLADVATAYLLNAQARYDLRAAVEAERDSLMRLQALDLAKTEFVSSVIHEIRTPMTSISGYAEMLRDHSAGDLTEQQQHIVDVISRNCDRLGALADDLLTLSTFEPGAFIGDTGDVDLCALVAVVEGTLAGVLVGRDLTVTFEVPDAPVVVRGVAVQLERMLSNLVSNAVKFTHDGGWVRCVLRVLDDRAVLKVSDNGIGIPEGEQDELFTRFFRSSTAHKEAISGSGLGLTIVRSIVDSHHGAISVTSAHMEGSTFTVDLPVVVAARPPVRGRRGTGIDGVESGGPLSRTAGMRTQPEASLEPPLPTSA